VEVLTHTRHPGAPSTAHPGKLCASLEFNHTNPGDPFNIRRSGRLPVELRLKALAELKMEVGQRYDHDRCPIDPGADSTAKDVVCVLDQVIYCHRCAAHGVRYQNFRPGIFPLATLCANTPTDMEEMGRAMVHWAHARLEFQHRYPHLSEIIHREAYQNVLRALHGADDPRIAMVFDSNLDIVRGEGVWLAARDLQVTKFDHDVASGLPSLHDVINIQDKNKKIAVLNRVRRSQATNRTPAGYTPIRRVIGITFVSGDSFIPMSAPPAPKHPIELLKTPQPLDVVRQSFLLAFPKLSFRYLRACLAAAICGDVGGDLPPMLACTGPAGSGKERHIVLAASLLGQVPEKLVLTDDTEKFTRQIGAAITAGNRFLIVDELAKTRDLLAKARALLEISTTLHWRPLYQTNRIAIRVGAAFYFPGVAFPEILASSEEFDRRIRRDHLSFKIPGWRVENWRDHSPENAQLANSLLTHTWGICRDHEFEFNAIAEALGLGRISDDAPGVDPEVLRRIYHHIHGDDGTRQFIEGNASFARGKYVNADSPHLRELLSSFVDHDASDRKQSLYAAKRNLQAPGWNDLLGISDPPILCQVRIHGLTWGICFQSYGVIRGRELLNEQLPPISGDIVAPAIETASPSGALPSTAPPGDPPSMGAPSQSTSPSDIDPREVLRSAGFPA